jgi:hypothetical protein
MYSIFVKIINLPGSSFEKYAFILIVLPIFEHFDIQTLYS